MIICNCYAESDVTGAWYAYKYERNGQEYDPAEFMLYQVIGLYPTGNNNKAYIVREGGIQQEGSWMAKDNFITITIDSKKSIFQMKDGLLTQTVDGGTLLFAKETDLNTPNDIKESKEESYYGTWELCRFSSNGIFFSLRMVELFDKDMSGKIEISKDDAYFVFDNGDKPVTWNGQPRYSGGKIYFANGALTMTDTDELYLTLKNVRYYFKKSISIINTDEWVCTTCGNTVSGNFCNNCGTARMSDEWVCSNCGREATGNFCSNCGAGKLPETPTILSEIVKVKLSSGREVNVRKSNKEAMDAYEALMDGYKEAIEKLAKGDYAGYMAFWEKYMDTCEKIKKMEEDFTDDEALYYLEVSTRILQKMY